MILSVSASHEDAVTKYAWMKYKGSRGKEVSQRTHKRMIRDGDTFGILPLRNGGRYTLIFADMPHVDFPLDKTTGLFLIERSSKLRKVPDVVQRETRTKTAGAKTMQRQINRVQFDAARFSPKSVKSEAVYGVNFDNYQWRMVPSMEYPIKTSKGMLKLYKNDMIGVRFLRQGKGGVVINTEGLFVKIDDAQYDLLVHDTNILPFNDWPKGEVNIDTLKAYRKQVRRHRKRSQLEEEEAVRLANNAKILEQKQQRKELAKETRKKQQARAAEMKDLRSKVKSGEIEAPKAEVRTVYEDGIDKRGKRVRVIEHEELDDAIEEVEIDLDFDEQKLEDVLSRSPFAGDMFNIEDSVGSLFGGDDSEDHEEPALDLSDIDEPEDDEEDTPPPKVRPKKGAKPAKPAPEEEEEDSTDGEEEEEDPDAEEDVDDSDPDVDDESNEDDTADDDSESVDDEGADDEGADSEDSGAEDDEASDDDPEADATDAVDENDAEEDQDSDVAAAEAEAKETAKKIAAANKSTPNARAEEAEEGDVLRFRADAKLNRDWVIVRVSTHNASDNIVVYTLYDITNSPDEVRQVRVNRARKQNLFDYAEHVKDMAPKLFNRVIDMVEDYPVNKDPIAS
ncbi:hypothetical protein MPK64_gp153 [Erwinia phage pEa_SNUABM_16]|uniref:KTSC and Metallopeptidase-like N-terminal fusion domain-containing protein n=1 Tax=Erwinia phage pEa_SNUABM_16 TaxID=2869544 RepID=A0AAE8XQH2_9CAUD|nr:hypothetical protein MPK64_gp153 [Erwinia phage pEa_SNUABM_16]QZE59056.1 hypothetical protein pEaSNUABM18_00153 [Erwinia phage pEa_SNUABM_18]UAW96297.1 hypothetical protein pEaSNUABM16_00153 [Erwinia phage pEa_SNUABM_16]